MTKESWVSAYINKFDECLEQGMTDKDANVIAVEWAEGAWERELDQAEYRKDSVEDR